MHSRRLDINGTVFLRSIYFYRMQALIAIENTVTVSTDNDFCFFLLGWYYYIGLLIREGGPKYRFAYVTIKGKSGPVYCTEREQNSIYIINIIIDFSQARIQALSKTLLTL